MHPLPVASMFSPTRRNGAKRKTFQHRHTVVEQPRNAGLPRYEWLHLDSHSQWSERVRRLPLRREEKGREQQAFAQHQLYQLHHPRCIRIPTAWNQQRFVAPRRTEVYQHSTHRFQGQHSHHLRYQHLQVAQWQCAHQYIGAWNLPHEEGRTYL